MNDFYEDDEPVEKVVGAFKRGKKGVTARTEQKVDITSAPDGFSLTSTKATPPKSVRTSEPKIFQHFVSSH